MEPQDPGEAKPDNICLKVTVCLLADDVMKMRQRPIMHAGLARTAQAPSSSMFRVVKILSDEPLGFLGDERKEEEAAERKEKGWDDFDTGNEEEEEARRIEKQMRRRVTSSNKRKAS